MEWWFKRGLELISEIGPAGDGLRQAEIGPAGDGLRRAGIGPAGDGLRRPAGDDHI